MKSALSSLGVVLLCLCVALYGAASSAGTTTDIGISEMVICSTDGPQTIAIDADGNPVTPTARCCECLACNAPMVAFVSDAFHHRAVPNQYCKQTIAATDQVPAPIVNARPQARAPPRADTFKGARAVLSCGLVCKGTTT